MPISVELPAKPSRVTVDLERSSLLVIDMQNGFFREFWPIVVLDCCEAIGPKGARRASLWNIRTLFRWTSTSRSLIKALTSSLLRMDSQDHHKKREMA